MHFSLNDWIGFAGVSILLIAYLLNLWELIPKDGIAYLLMNIAGAGLACLASCLIHYVPFIVLEGTWTLVSCVALIRYLNRRSP